MKLSASELRGILLVIAGVFALGYYYSWWFQNGLPQSGWLIAGLIVALFYGVIQLLFSWTIYLATHHRSQRLPQSVEDLTIDVFVTACGEEYELIQRALTAACAMRGEHRTWLLDDGHDPALADLARRLGAGYLTRPDRKHAKAGNINAALARTDGDIIVIFDIDHAPVPSFLEATIGYFSDPGVGFIQVMLTFANGEDGWIAQAADESSHDFYNSISTGADALLSATLVGTNALIRRSALDSIGGYQPGLAEDLETSIALHAAGWQSLYVAEPLAPGYAPPDLMAWFTQQFKWARGVFETFITRYPFYFSALTVQQRLVYAVRMTYYWFGLVVCIHLFAALFVLFSNNPQVMAGFEGYLLHLLPVASMVLLIRLLALRRWRHASIHSNLQWKPVILVFATWPIYTLAWLMALLRVPLRFRPTPKTRGGTLHPAWLVTQISCTLLLISGLIYHFAMPQEHYCLLSLGFAFALIASHLLFFWQCWIGETSRTKYRPPTTPSVVGSDPSLN